MIIFDSSATTHLLPSCLIRHSNYFFQKYFLVAPLRLSSFTCVFWFQSLLPNLLHSLMTPLVCQTFPSPNHSTIRLIFLKYLLEEVASQG